MINNPRVEIKRIIRLLANGESSISVANEMMRNLIDILATSSSARTAFRVSEGDQLLEKLFSTFKKAVSPEKSNVKSGLPELEVVRQIELTIRLLATCVSFCPEMMVAFEDRLGTNQLYRLFLPLGCFYESERLEDGTEMVDLELDLRMEVAKYLESNEPLSIRRLMLIISPLVHCAIDNDKIIIPSFIHLIIKLTPHILILDKGQRCTVQVKLLTFVSELLRDSDNLETMSLCTSQSQKLVEIMLSGVYLTQQKLAADHPLRKVIHAIFEKLVLVSVPIELFREYLRFDGPLGSRGMGIEGGPISERAYRSVLKILKRARRPTYQRPGAIVFNSLTDTVAPRSITISNFLQPQV